MGEHLALERTRLHGQTLFLLGIPHGKKIQLYGLACRLLLFLGRLLNPYRLLHRLYDVLHRHILKIKSLLQVILHEAVKAGLQSLAEIFNATVPFAYNGKLAVLVLTEEMITKIGGISIPDMLGHEDIGIGIGLTVQSILTRAKSQSIEECRQVGLVIDVVNESTLFGTVGRIIGILQTVLLKDNQV